MTGSQRGYTEDMHVVLHSLAGSLGRGLEQRAHVHVETAVGIACSYNLGTTVVTVLTHFCNHDTGLTTLAFREFLSHFLSFEEVGIIFRFA